MKKIINPILDCNTLDLSNVEFQIVHSANYVNKNDPTITGPHVHNGYEFYLNISGDVSFLIKNKLYPVKKGEFAISLPNDVHHCVYNKSGIVEYFVLWVNAEKNSPILNFIKNKNFAPLMVFNNATKEKLIEKFYKLHDLCLNENNNQLLITTTIMEIFSIINTGENLLELTNVKNNIPPQFEFILENIKENLSKINTIKDLAEICFLSTATINRWFRKYLHLSPKEYLETKKLSIAKDLLSKGASVTECAFEAGFYDASHFISVFKKRFNCTPYKYFKQDNIDKF